MSTSLIRVALGMLLTVTVLLHTTELLRLPAITQLENSLYDMRLRFTAPSGVDPRVVIIDIDEGSLTRYGQFPWRRDVIAKLVESLFSRYGVELLGFDVVFAEPDVDPTLEQLRAIVARHGSDGDAELTALANTPSRDQLLSQTLNDHLVVMGYTFRATTNQKSIGTLPAPLYNPESGYAELTRATNAERYTANLDILQSDRDGGFFSLFNGFDADGILRSVPLLSRYQGALYPALSLSIAKAYLGLDIVPVIAPGKQVGDYAALEGLDLGLHQIPVDHEARVFVPYRKRGGYRYIAAADVLDGVVTNPDELAGTVALLGTSAAGLVDLRATPISTVLPGVEVHANLVAALIDGNFRSRPHWSNLIEAMILLLTGFALILVLPRLSASAMSVMVALVLSTGIAINFWLWNSSMLVVSLAPFIILIAAIYLLNIVFGFLVESRSRLALKRSFGLYVPPEIIDNMEGQSMEALLRSERRQMTVLFTDVRGFTTISETLEPQALSELMNSFLTPMTEIVHRHGGAIDKYMGDAMMAFWGAPLDTPDHASKALAAAIEMTRTLDQLNPSFTERGWPQISVGVGLNTGEMNVGNMGSEFRMAYTVLGDAVNLGARLEGLTKAYGVPILLSEFTARDCPDYTFCELDLVRVKGKRESVRIYTPLGRTVEVGDQDLEFKAGFEQALALYRNRDFQDAQRAFTTLATRTGEITGFAQPAVRFYLLRIGQLMADPPGADWAGVYEFETK